MLAKIYADFNNADADGRLRLNTVGTIEDLSRQRIKLREGRRLTLTSDGIEAEGIATFSQKECVWVAVIDWAAVRHIGLTG